LEEVNRYPQGGQELKEELSRRFGLREENIILGNGSDEIIEMAVRVFLREGDEVIIPYPSFAYYEIASLAEGGRCVKVPLREHRIDLKGVAHSVTPRTRLIFLNNPNNPTGTIYTREEFQSLLEELPKGVVVIVDEAYGEYVSSQEYPRYQEYLEGDHWILTLKTFSKFYGLAGMRIGYALAREEIIGFLERVHQPFNVNSLALVAALAALRDEEYQRKTQSLNLEGRAYLSEEMRRLGVRFVPTEANFFLIEIGEGVKDLMEMLREEGVAVRDMEGYGLHGFLRVTIGLPEENKRFIEVLQRWKMT